jgi:hypothetical protein
MEKRETEPEKKMNQIGGRGVLYSSFSDSITDGIVVDGIKFRQ